MYNLSLLRAGANLNFLLFSPVKETQCKLQTLIHLNISPQGDAIIIIIKKLQLTFFAMPHFKLNMIHRFYETFYDHFTSVKFDYFNSLIHRKS